MALVIETGVIVAGAESYVSVVDATAYHANRGNAAWSALASDVLREQALRKATDYMEATYSTRWAGDRVSASQALSWPRAGVVVNGFAVLSNIVPLAVKNACAELALRAAAGELLADQAQGVKEKTVGPITIVYDEASPQTKKYPAIDHALRPYLSGGDGNVKLIRS